ncbi:MAG TPA: MBL fold metallo-hydrolase [Longimicrobiaceae bacterium]|nr:MBL fold metallo-hydrolase [Longimicrobiaceae bacterium]
MSRPEPLVQPLRIGELKCHAIQAGGQRLDGGAMFGVVPKPLWEKRIPADERNRIQLGMRCLLVEHPDGLLLIDTGAGNKETPKFLDIYGIENEGAQARTALEDGIRAAGHAPEAVAVVINTHLHFDHAGGNTFSDASGEAKIAFPNAEYFVQRGEYDYATHTNERTAASYFERNYVPIDRAGKLRLLDGETEVMGGVRVIVTPGHTPFHQSVLVTSGADRACFLGDIAPTAAHLPLPWIMGYDVEPLVTLETKRRLFAQALAEEWLLIFEHDAVKPWGRIAHDGKSYTLVEND